VRLLRATGRYSVGVGEERKTKIEEMGEEKKKRKEKKRKEKKKERERERKRRWKKRREEKRVDEYQEQLCHSNEQVPPS
jgi:hypothetical protein